MKPVILFRLNSHFKLKIMKIKAYLTKNEYFI